MSHYKFNPAKKQDMFHDDRVDEPLKKHSKIYPTGDCSISRENPNRKLPNSDVLVVGFDSSGTFNKIIPEGNTHGYWTLTGLNPASPEDGAGASGDYVSRILMEFDLADAGITSGDAIERASLQLTVFQSKTIEGSSSFDFDFFRFHPGTTINNTAGYENHFTENATWYEYDYSGTGLTTGTYATGDFGVTDSNHGTNRWDYQGLGVTGSTAEHSGGGDTGQWVDISGGTSSSNIDEYSDNIYKYAMSLSRWEVIGGEMLYLDLTSAAQDALANYLGKMRIMIRLRDDQSYDNTDTEAFVSFYSSSSLRDTSTFSQSKGSQIPTLSVDYFDVT
jgi:hypothetical protein